MRNFDRIFIRGDTHGDFDFLDDFCEKACTTTHDLLIILGDASINYYPPNHKWHMELTSKLRHMPITLFCIRGNHEDRPEDRPEYHCEDVGIGDPVYVSNWMPNVWFAKSVGEYVLDGMKCLVAGGAYSVDKLRRITNGDKWVANEQLTYEEKYKLLQIAERDIWDHVFTHTCPIDWMPRDLFLPDIDQTKVDNTMENLFQAMIECDIKFKHWWFGHYHDHRMDVCGDRKVHMLYKTIVELPSI